MEVASRMFLGFMGEKMNDVTSKEQGKTSTILTFVNTVGVVFPPIVIHKGGKVLDTWTCGTPQHVRVEMSKRWIDKKIFNE